MKTIAIHSLQALLPMMLLSGILLSAEPVNKNNADPPGTKGVPGRPGSPDTKGPPPKKSATTPPDMANVVSEAVDSARAIEPDRPIDLSLNGAASVVTGTTGNGYTSTVTPAGGTEQSPTPIALGTQTYTSSAEFLFDLPVTIAGVAHGTVLTDNSLDLRMPDGSHWILRPR